jgi:alkylation response protein AidB-like acyl-CoA dehydrogenase
MGQASVGLTISLGVSTLPFVFASLSPEPEMQKLVKDYCADEKAEIIGCWAITEPDHGSDWLVDPNTEDTQPKVVPSVRAVLDGNEYVVNGQKSAWVSNGTIATHAALFVTIDPSQGLRGSGIVIAPLDLPGVTRGKPLEKMGQRDLNQGEIFFEDVRIPKSHMICAEPDLYVAISDRNLAGANASMGSLFTGVAQAAYDEAEAYARVRIQGGKPIIEHQNIKLKLFNMFTQLEAARSLSRRAYRYNRLAETPALHYSIASKNFCTETAFKVASEAIQVFGGVGLTKEYPIEKIFRDARAGMIEDGVNETLALGGADWLFA